MDKDSVGYMWLVFVIVTVIFLVIGAGLGILVGN